MAIFVALLTAFAVYLGALLLFSGASFAAQPGPTSFTGPAPFRPVEKCRRVSAHTYNKRLKKLDALTGYRHRKKSRPVCIADYRALGRTVRKARRDCFKKYVHYTGSSFYGYGDSGGIVGSCGIHLLTARARNSFAILQSGDVASRCGQRFFFNRNGVTRSGIQADTGGGGGGVGGHARTFDFWNPPSGDGLARALGLTSSGLAVVAYSTRNCWI